MTSLIVTGVGKSYRTNKGPSPWEQFLGWFKRTGADTKKSTREIWALKDVSFSVEPGTILGVIGPNGAGKTTLLKVLARITPPTEGRVVGRGAVAPLLELGAGLQPELTARENIGLYMTWHGIASAAARDRLDEIVAFAEVGDFLDTPLKRFSSGMYVRLAFSIAVNMRPDILLADEILAVGDIAFQERCMQRVQEAGAAGMTVLFVSHDMAAIQRLCSRVIWLNGGRLIQDGDAAAVVAQYEQSAWTMASERKAKGDHVSDYGAILSVRMLSPDGREIGAARTGDALHLSVTFSLLQPDVAARCIMVVLTRGIVAFRSAQPDDVVASEPGIFTASLEIPPHLLADTIYTIKVGILLDADGGEQKPLVLDNALTFRVYADDDPSRRSLVARNVYHGAGWSGAVMPRLQWTSGRQRDIVTTADAPSVSEVTR